VRHRVDLTPSSKMMLGAIAQELSIPDASLSTTAQMCIQSVYDNLVEGGVSFEEELSPTQRKLDEILSILQELQPEFD
jgi:hypothetical protein